MNNIINEFKNKVVSFLDELIEQFPEESDFIIARIFLKDQIPTETIILTFIKNIMPYKEQIKDRDEMFFLNSDIALFGEVNKEKVNNLKLLWKSSRLDNEDKEVMWKWFDIFIFLAEKYQQHQKN